MGTAPVLHLPHVLPGPSLVLASQSVVPWAHPPCRATLGSQDADLGRPLEWAALRRGVMIPAPTCVSSAVAQTWWPQPALWWKGQEEDPTLAVIRRTR